MGRWTHYCGCADDPAEVSNGPSPFRIRILSISSRIFAIAIKSRSNGHNQLINERIGTEKWEVQTKNSGIKRLE
jgi:hypothetical protein